MNLNIRRQTMSDDPGVATVIAPSGETKDIELVEEAPGIFTGVMEASEIGLYQIGNGDLAALAHVGPVNAPEFADARSSTDLLRG